MIIQLDEAKRTLLEKRENIKELAAALKLDELKEETENLEKLTVEADFWGREDSGAILKRIKYLKERVGAYEQLKEKLDLSYLDSPRRFLFKSIWLVIEFAAITAIIAIIFYVIKLLGLFSLVHDIPVSVISVIFGFMLLLSLVTDTLGLMKSLYFSKDNTVLLTFPATPSLIFFSKLVTYYVYELRRSFMFTIPMFIAYGIVKGY